MSKVESVALSQKAFERLNNKIARVYAALEKFLDAAEHLRRSPAAEMGRAEKLYLQAAWEVELLGQLWHVESHALEQKRKKARRARGEV